MVQAGDTWRYLLPTAQPSSDWTSSSFDDSSWSTGSSGFGYGDDDDQTVVPTTISIYIRHSFEITNLTDLEDVLLHMDYDDGFVAYLNGTEVARQLVSGTPPAFDQASDGLHEGLLHRGLTPEKFNIDLRFLRSGTNILAVEVHNESLTSSDLTINPFLSVGTNSSSQVYETPPSWFSAPLHFTSSSLPIVTINTNGQEITNDPKVAANIGIIHDPSSDLNLLSDSPNELDWFCGIEIRGESSQLFDKKSYGFEIWDTDGNDMDTTFLGFPSEEDFILYGPYSDKSLFNNALTMYLGNEMGHYASRTRFVELVVNEEYMGLYLLMEKIKRDKNRVDISKLNPDEITADDLTGGYIFRIDKGFYDGWESQFDIYNGPGRKIFFQFFYPNQDDIHPVQGAYIQEYMDSFEQAVASSTNKNADGVHYAQYIDLRSFVDTFILNELSKNIDAYRLSSYFHKQKDSKGGKISAGPLWDFNLSYGNSDFCGVEGPEGWEYYQCQGNSPFWWHNMLQDTLFTNALKCRWTDLRSSTLATENIDNYLDSMTDLLGDAVTRNYERWPTLGTYVWPNSSFYAQASTHTEVMNIMKDWLAQRVLWMDENIPGVANHCEVYENFNVLGASDIADSILIYPNPTDGILKIKSSLTIRGIDVIDIQGQTIFRIEESDLSPELKLPARIRSGMYFLQLSTNEGMVLKRIILDR